MLSPLPYTKEWAGMFQGENVDDGRQALSINRKMVMH